MKNYFIKEDYRINKKIETFDYCSKKTFWNRKNIKYSYYSQYYVYQLAYKIAKQNQIKTILDIGCGVATQLNNFFGKEFTIYGIDQEPAINICKQKYNTGVFLSNNLESPTLELKSYINTAPLIICADVIEHLLDPDKLLVYIKSFSDQNTIIIFSTPERDLLGRRSIFTPASPFHIREWNSQEFKDYILNSSFKIKSHQIVRTCKLCFDITTVKFIVGQLINDSFIKSTQVIVCNKVN